MIPLAAVEEIIDASGVAPRIEAALPVGVRARQLSVRTLLAGMCLAQADHRPAHLTRLRQALIALSEDDQKRLGVTAPLAVISMRTFSASRITLTRSSWLGVWAAAATTPISSNDTKMITGCFRISPLPTCGPGPQFLPAT